MFEDTPQKFHKCERLSGNRCDFVIKTHSSMHISNGTNIFAVESGLPGGSGSSLFLGNLVAVPMKSPAVVDAKMDPVIYQSYKSFVCFATCWLVLIYTPLKFTWWGMLGALIWAINGSAAVLAVQLVGIGLAQSLWSSLSIIVSYIWGAYIFREASKNDALSLVAVFFMMAGMLGVGFTVGNQSVKKPANHCSSSGVDELDSSLLGTEANESMKHAQKDSRQVKWLRFNLLKGLGLATTVGILNGGFLIPLKYAHKDVTGVEYLVSFGVGSMLITILILGIYWCLCKLSGYPFPSFKIIEGAKPALLTGILWSLGNFLSIYATLYLGFSLGWPLVQCQILISACWAVFFYKEASSRMDAFILVASSCVVVGGAVMLSYYGVVG